jgi:hypothetical protein
MEAKNFCGLFSEFFIDIEPIPNKMALAPKLAVAEKHIVKIWI